MTALAKMQHLIFTFCSGECTGWSAREVLCIPYGKVGTDLSPELPGGAGTLEIMHRSLALTLFTNENECSIIRMNSEGGVAVRDRRESCCFTGHRPGKLPWRYNEMDPRCLALKHRMADAVELAYEEGFRHFLCGMARGCDLYFCEAALSLREAHPDVTVEAAIPCPTQADMWPAAQRERYARLVAACDFETMVSDHYTSVCMRRRNRYMVEHASLIIAAFDGSAGGTRYTVEYAMRQGLAIVDLPILAE